MGNSMTLILKEVLRAHHEVTLINPLHVPLASIQ